MATKIYGVEGDLPQWSYPGSIGGASSGTDMTGYYPWPIPGGSQARYLNKCVDGITGQWHLWETFFQDRTGVYYVQSGGQQFDSGTYKVETITYSRDPI